MKKVGEQLALLRKEKGYTQEALAESINISPQAISKWENGHSLPETSLLPMLARKFGCSIDTILIPGELQILEAIYTDGFTEFDVTERLNKLVDNDKLSATIGEEALLKVNNKDRIWFVLVKYKTTYGVFYTYAKQDEYLYIDTDKKGMKVETEVEVEKKEEDIEKEKKKDRSLRIIDAYYGNSEVNCNVMHKINHYDFFNLSKYNVNHETFPSNPSTSKKEYLSIIYINDKGINLTVCEENESIAYSSDRKRLYRVPSMADKKVIEGIEALGFGERMDCTWAGALTVALRSLGIDTTYEKVMGVSGACYRIAFHPVWDYSSVDGLVAYDYATPGYKAFSYKHVHAERVPKEYREDERNRIINDLNRNIPVLAINLRVAAEWGVITGYEQQGKILLCRTYFDKEIINSEFSGKDRYLPADNWPFIISHFDEKIDPPTDKENLINSLKVMIDCNNKKDNRCGYAMGYEAYRIWSEALRDNKLFSENGKNNGNNKKNEDNNRNSDRKNNKDNNKDNNDDNDRNYKDFIRRLDVNHYCIMSLADARRCAYEYIRDSSKLFEGDKREELTRLSDIYKEIYEYINELLNKLPCLSCAETVDKLNAREIWTEELRNEQANILDKVLVLEKKAEKKAREILVLIKKERDKLKPELLEPKIIKKRGILVAGVCGNGNETAKLWQKYEQLERNNPIKNKVDDWGYEVRLYDETNKCECYVGVCVDKSVTQSCYSSIILPDNILYAVFDIYPIEGYESQNKFMDDWLEKNKDKYEQYKIDDRYFVVEYYGERFKGNDDIESVVEIWIPIIKKH